MHWCEPGWRTLLCPRRQSPLLPERHLSPPALARVRAAPRWGVCGSAAAAGAAPQQWHRREEHRGADSRRNCSGLLRAAARAGHSGGASRPPAAPG